MNDSSKEAAASMTEFSDLASDLDAFWYGEALAAADDYWGDDQ